MTAPAVTAPAPAHQARVVTVTGRYPFRPACSCGWQHPIGYVAAHAAQIMADDHVDREVMEVAL